MTDPIEEMARKAAAASPGEWRILEVMDEKFMATPAYEGHPYFGCARFADVLGDEDYPRKEADMEFVVAAQPVAIVALYKQTAEREKQVRELVLAARSVHKYAHATNCAFDGCTCGAVEEFKSNRERLRAILEQFKEVK